MIEAILAADLVGNIGCTDVHVQLYHVESLSDIQTLSLSPAHRLETYR